MTALALLLLASPVVWQQSTHADFSTGSFTNAANGIYISARGRIKTVDRWDLDGDGYLDLAFANSHPHSEKLDGVIYWGNSRTFDAARSTAIPNNGSQWSIPIDFDGDGQLDLLAPNYHNGTFDKMDSYAYYGGETKVAPWFFPPFNRRISLPSQAAQHAAAADLNKDGYVDIVLAFSGGFWEYRANPRVPYQDPSRIYWGSAAGFDPKRYSEIPTPAVSCVAVADLNADGWMELVVGRHESKTSLDVDSHIYWGGLEGFSAARRTALPTHGVNMVRVADINRDSRLDVLFANGAGNVSYAYLGDGESFSPGRRLEFETSDARDVQIGDVNRDGYPDVFFSNHQRAGNPMFVSWLYMGSPQGFTERREFETVGAFGSAIADLNQDGWPDLVVANHREYTSYDISSYIYWNSPQGFDPLRRTALPTHGAAGVAAADFNRDGHADLLINNTAGEYRGGYHPVTLYWGDPKGQYSRSRRLELPAVDSYQVRAADFNDDGYPDLLAGSSGEDRRLFQESYLYWGSATGFDRNRRSTVMGHRAMGFGIADLDRDGYLDLIVCNSNSQMLDATPRNSLIYWGAKDGYSPLDTTALPTDAPHSVVTADLNGDGSLDLLLDGPRGDRGSVIYWGGHGRNYGSERRTYVPGSVGTTYPGAADLDRDGVLDLVLPGGGVLRIYHGLPGGEFPASRRVTLPAQGALRPVIADLDGNGWLDLAVPSYNTGTSRNTMSRVYYGGPEGYGEERSRLLPTYGGTGGLAADFNRDGYMDLLFMCHRKEGDPDRSGSFGEHITTSFLYWGGADGLQPDRRLEIPTEGVHNDYSVDLGNIRNRQYEFEYVSEAHHQPGHPPSRIFWKGETPHGSRLVFQLRSAPVRDALAGAPWTGNYESSGAAISGVSGEWIQYRVRFLSPDGVNYPVLDEVKIEFR